MRRRMKFKHLTLLLIPIKMIFLSFLVSRIIWRTGPADLLLILGITTWIFLVLLAWGYRRRLSSYAVYAGLFLLTLMVIPSTSLQNLIPGYKQSTLITPANLTGLMVISTALMVAAFLIFVGLDQQKAPGTTRILWFPLALCMLLLVKIFHSLFWFMVWDTTYDALSFFWLPVPILAVLFSTIMMVVTLPGWRKATGIIYGVLLIPLVITISYLAWQVDFRQLTEERAENVSHLVEAYYAREGRYPDDLNQLTPRYALILREPVIIYPQDWCYQSGADYYTLGYVNRDHWSDPRLYGVISASAGHVPPGLQVCTAEITAIQERFPDYPYQHLKSGN